MTKLSGEITEKDFPHKGILWRGWGDETLRIIQEKNRPVLLFVADTDPFVRPFLREIFKAMPANARLRQLLNDVYPALFIEADSVRLRTSRRWALEAITTSPCCRPVV